MKLNVFFIFFDKRWWTAWKKKKKIWGKVSCSIKKGFDGESVYNEQYLKTKSLMKEKSTQILMMKEYQKKVLIVFVYS